MKCEKCASEMPGSRVICPECGFNNALHRVDKWKAQRQTPKTESPELEAKSVSPVAAKVRARYASEANLIHFPVTPKTETATDKTPAPDPVWREQTKARVRQHLDRRKSEDDGTPDVPALPSAPSEEITAQLIVESALKRIRRTSASPPPTPLNAPRQTMRGGNQALARAYEPEEQLIPEPLPEPAPPQAEPAAPAMPAFRAYANSAPRPVTKLPNRHATNETSTAPDFEADAADESAWADDAAMFNEAAPLTAEKLPAETPRTITPHTAPAETAPTAAETRKANLWVGKPAPLWLRALAGAVDLEAAALAYLPFFGMYTSLDGPPGWADIYIMASSLAVVVYLYLLITYSFNGRTFGMALCGLRCVDVADASTPIQFQRRLWQALGGTVALLCPPFNYVVTRVTSYQRGFADALGQTITLRRSQD
jgi:uncharacterized RDD family membrane protein YckC